MRFRPSSPSKKARNTEPAELVIERLSHEGRGIAHHEGRIVFVEQALTGERVLAKFTSLKGSYAEATTEQIIEASPLRVEPPCPHFSVCGGCSLQHMHSSAQLEFKEGMVHEKLQHGMGASSYERLPVISSSTQGYRRKARLAVRHVGKKERVLVGFRERSSSFIADMDSCLVLEPKVGRLLPLLATLIQSMDASRQLPQVEVAVGDALPGKPSCALVFRHLAPLSPADLQRLRDFAVEQVLDLYLQPQGTESVHKLHPVGGEDRLYYRHPDFDLELAFHPMDFTQVNAAVNQAMVLKALDLLDPGPQESVLDLFCGLGNFTLPLARRAARVLGVEGVEAMVSRGYENAKRNGITNADFICADLTRPPEQHEWLQQGFGKVLLDPPRSGAIEVLPAVIAAKPRRIVYVSCNPATLARDAAWLGENGYRLQAAGAMDMFPHTGHVEAIALFEPA
jgi:23S rRNA (uracil1939-C5)-methyltransferase